MSEGLALAVGRAGRCARPPAAGKLPAPHGGLHPGRIAGRADGERTRTAGATEGRRASLGRGRGPGRPPSGTTVPLQSVPWNPAAELVAQVEAVSRPRESLVSSATVPTDSAARASVQRLALQRREEALRHCGSPRCRLRSARRESERHHTSRGCDGESTAPEPRGRHRPASEPTADDDATRSTRSGRHRARGPSRRRRNAPGSRSWTRRPSGSGLQRERGVAFA